MTYAAPTWYERDGKRHDMKNGRSGIAEAMQTSPADADTPAEEISWWGAIGQLEVAQGSHSGRFSVYRQRPLNVKMSGLGDESIVRSVITGEKYADDHIDRMNPAIHRLVFTDCVVDVSKANSPYPIVTSANSRLGTFGFRHCTVKSNASGPVKTIFRGNASGRYKFTDIKADSGAKEYLVYTNAGAGDSVFRNLDGANFGRGIIQTVLRTTENGWYRMEEDSGNSLLIENISAEWCGAAGSSAVSVTGWADDITIRDIGVNTLFNTAAISLRFDKKQADLDDIYNPKTANIIGRGQMLTSGHAHGTVLIDLEGSYIRTGQDTPGQQSKSSRPALMIDSCYDLWLVSNAATSISAGNGTNKSLHLEHQGAGAIRTVTGEKIGTRAVESFRTSGNFSSFGPMYRAGQPMSADEYLSAR